MASEWMVVKRDIALYDEYEKKTVTLNKYVNVFIVYLILSHHHLICLYYTSGKMMFG